MYMTRINTRTEGRRRALELKMRVEEECPASRRRVRRSVAEYFQLLNGLTPTEIHSTAVCEKVF
jgi:hypothetical protein